MSTSEGPSSEPIFEPAAGKQPGEGETLGEIVRRCIGKRFRSEQEAKVAAERVKAVGRGFDEHFNSHSELRVAVERAGARFKKICEMAKEGENSSEDYDSLDEGERSLLASMKELRANIKFTKDELEKWGLNLPRSGEEWIRLARITEMPGEPIDSTGSEIFENAIAWIEEERVRQEREGLRKAVAANLEMEKRRNGEPPAPPAGEQPGDGEKQGASETRLRTDPRKPGRDRQDDILSAIRAAEMPLMRSELIEKMKLKTEGKLGANLAWMVENGILINLAQRGYWFAGEPEPK